MAVFFFNGLDKNGNYDFPVRSGVKAGFYEKPDGSVCMEACAATFAAPLHICENGNGLYADRDDNSNRPCKGLWKVDFLME